VAASIWGFVRLGDDTGSAVTGLDMPRRAAVFQPALDNPGPVNQRINIRQEYYLILSYRWTRPEVNCEVVLGADMDHCQSSHLAHSIIALFLLSSCWTGNGIFAWGQVGINATVDSVAKPQVHEVVSIKPDNSGPLGGSVRNLPDGFRDTGVVFATLVRSAYSIIGERQVVDMPAWAEKSKNKRVLFCLHFGGASR
jgi:hypothetical protein